MSSQDQKPTLNQLLLHPSRLELKHYNLPFYDRMMPDDCTPVIFFYHNPQPLIRETTIANLLKKSLSQSLSKYYPFAGRLSSTGSYVECNDAGVQFFEARIACKLSDILKKSSTQASAMEKNALVISFHLDQYGVRNSILFYCLFS